MSDTATVTYYDKNAEAFFEQTVGVDMRPLYDRFLVHVPADGHILDAGCGSGRDAKAFLDRGFRVTAFDASPALARKAGIFLGQEVRCCRFDEIVDVDTYDGVWACASLLYIGTNELQGTMARLAATLRRGGILYASFKKGEGERMDAGGRHFTDITLEALQRLVRDSGELSLLEAWETRDQWPGRKDELWWNFTARRS
jgi:SAM-dependent methyltransferase